MICTLLCNSNHYSAHDIHETPNIEVPKSTFSFLETVGSKDLLCSIFHVPLAQNDPPVKSCEYFQLSAVRPQRGRHVASMKWDCARFALNSFLDLDPGLREESLWITVYDDH